MDIFLTKVHVIKSSQYLKKTSISHGYFSNEIDNFVHSYED